METPKNKKRIDNTDIVFTVDSESEGYYTGYIRGLPELVAQGKTKSETVENLLSRLIDIYDSILRGED